MGHRGIGGSTAGPTVFNVALAVDRRSGPTVAATSPAGEESARSVAGARTAAAFHSMAWQHLAARGGIPADGSVCGDDPGVRAVAGSLDAQFGLAPAGGRPLCDVQLFEPPAVGWMCSAARSDVGRDLMYAPVHTR